jgi:hypothetical protein
MISMKKILKLKALTSVVLALSIIFGSMMIVQVPVMAATSTYYVSPDGDDSNDGTSSSTAWKTIDKVNTINFQQGDRILFEGGQTFSGTLQFDANDVGTQSDKIVVGSYGTGRAIVYAGNGYGIKVVGTVGIRIDDINVVGAGRLVQVLPDPADIGKWVYYTISGIWIDASQFIDVNAVEVSGFQHAGVCIVNSEDINITNVYAHQNGYMGIGTDYGDIGIIKRNDPTDPDLFSRRINISNCQAIDNPGDHTITTNHSGSGILLVECKDSIIQYSEAAHNGYDMGPNNSSAGGPVGIWIVNDTSEVIVQNNISHNNDSSNGIDGGGFDLDGYVYNNLFQYNYSYDNNGPSFLCFEYSQNPSTSWGDNTIRYNIGENDGAGSGKSNVTVGWKTKNTNIYNNTFFNSNGRFNISSASYGVRAYGYNFWNNIFYNTQGDKFTQNINNATNKFQGNAYYALNNRFDIDGYTSLPAWRAGTGQEMVGTTPVGINVDPKLTNPGNGEKLTDPTKLSDLNAYKLLDNSPMINAGLDIQALFGINAGSKDFYGNTNKVGGYFDIGAHESLAGEGVEPPVIDNTIPSVPEPTNFATNPGFENNTGVPQGWGRWAPISGDEAGVVVVDTNARSGNNALEVSKNVYTFQNIRNIPNGTYTFKAWVKVLGMGVNMEAKEFSDSGTTKNVWVDAATEDAYKQITIENINVTNGQCTIGLFSHTAGDTNSILIDDVQFFNSDTTVPVLNTTVIDITATAGKLRLNSNEAGTYYYMVYPTEATAPTASEIEAQDVGTAISMGTNTVPTGINEVRMTGLAATTAYRAYVILKDIAGNTSNIVIVPFTTLSPNNLVTNPGFEANIGGPITDWGRWSPNGTGTDACTAQNVGARTGNNALVFSKPSAPFNILTSKTISVPNGNYTMRAWVKTSGLGVNVEASDFTAVGFGYKNVQVVAGDNNEYQLITINNINVTKGMCKIGFAVNTNGSINTGSVSIDDVEFYNTDTTAPELINGDTSNITYATGTLNFTSDEAGTYYYLVNVADVSAPTASTIEAQGTAVTKGTGVAAMNNNTIDISDLTELSYYKAYVIVKDAAGNNSNILTITFETPSAIPDTTAPVLTNGATSNITGTTGTLTFTSDEVGRYSYLLYAADDSAPTADDIEAQGTAVTKGKATSRLGDNTIEMFSLSAATTYKAYIIVKDNAGNISNIVTIPFTTASTPINVISNPGFEASDSVTGGWRLWSGRSDNDLDASNITNVGAHSGGNALIVKKTTAAFSVYTVQDITGIDNGTYTLKLWLKRSGLGVNIEAKDYSLIGFGYKNVNMSAGTTVDYQMVTINDINVTNGQCTIGFMVSGDGNNNSLMIDDVELIRTDVPVADTTAPLLTNENISNLTETTGELNFTSDEIGTFYYLVYPTGDTAPNASDIEAQGTAVTKGTGDVAVGNNTINLSGMRAATRYTIYVVEKDTIGNTSNIITVPFTTITVNANSPDVVTNEIGIIINGELTGTETKYSEGGLFIVKFNANENHVDKKIDAMLEEQLKNPEINNNNVVQILVSDSTADRMIVGLNGDIIKKMDENELMLSIKETTIEYIIPAKEVTIEKIASDLGVDLNNLKDIDVEVRITKIDDQVTKIMEDLAKSLGHALVFPPVEFGLFAKTTTKDGITSEVQIDTFSNYVERILEIPTGIDPSMITTGIVFNADGTYEHVPTRVFEKEGTWYASMNSLTNSIYSVLFNSSTVVSVENHWSKVSVNDLASRLIIEDTINFNPDKAITRGQFAQFLTKALGIYRDNVEIDEKYSDEITMSVYANAIVKSIEYGIIKGYSDGSFRTEAYITREEAMVMCERAMNIVELIGDEDNRFSNYVDFLESSEWAKSSIKRVLSAKVFNGEKADVLAPKSKITNAEAITAIRNLLIESGLIND